MEMDSFESFYQDGAPPWEVDRPQPAVVELADSGQFTGRVLDVACGTGENSLYIAGLGHEVLGADGSSTALQRARDKAAERGISVEFAAVDALEVAGLRRRFDTVLDCAFLHIPGHTAETRRAYTSQLAQVLEPGGWVHLLEISDQEGPHPSITRSEILESFDDRWANAKVQETSYLTTMGEVSAWLVSLQLQ